MTEQQGYKPKPEEAIITIPPLLRAVSPPFDGSPITGRTVIKTHEIDYLRERLQQRNDINSHMKDRLAFTLGLLMGICGNRIGMEVVDVGCNTGIFTKTLARAGNRVVGLDINTKKIRIARKETQKLRNHIQFEAADATTDVEKHVAPASMDLALCTEVLEHVPNYQRVVEQIMTTLKPGGIFLLTVPKEGRVRDPGHINIFTKDTIIHLLSEYGEVAFHETPPEVSHLDRWFFISVRKQR